MRRTLVLALLAIASLAAALLLPRSGPPIGRATTTTTTTTVQLTPAGAGGPLVFQARPGRAAIHATGDAVDVVFQLTAPADATVPRAPVDLALVLDRSGSMDGEPFAKAQAAARALVARLAPTDRLSIVAFGSDARLELPLTTMDETGRTRALAVVNRLATDGGTNLSAGLELAHEDLLRAASREKAIRRVVLLSDGQANEGLTGAALVAVARRIATDRIRVSALGLGVEFDEDVMLALADHGGGQYRYLRDADELAAALGEELRQAAATAASALRLRLEPAPGVVLSNVLGYDARQENGVWTIGLSDLAVGETRHVVARVTVGSGGAGVRALVEGRLDYEVVAEAHRPATAQALARAEATVDAGRIAASWDKDTAAIGLRARWGGSVAAATQAYEDHREDERREIMKSGLAALLGDAKALGDEVLAGELQQNYAAAESSFARAPAAPDSDLGRLVRKELKDFSTSTARH